jgi:hypothetical protein
MSYDIKYSCLIWDRHARSQLTVFVFWNGTISFSVRRIHLYRLRRVVYRKHSDLSQINDATKFVIWEKFFSSWGNAIQRYNGMYCVLFANRYECVPYCAILLTHISHGSPDKACSTLQHRRLIIIYFHVRDVGNACRYTQPLEQEQYKHRNQFESANGGSVPLTGCSRNIWVTVFVYLFSSR